MTKKSCTMVLLSLAAGIVLLCTGCKNKFPNDLIYIVTDGVYIMESIDSGEVYPPSISFDTDENTFVFSYDPLSSYANHGTYIIEDNEVIATTSDKKYTYTFEIVDDNIVSFIADKSNSTKTVEGVTAVPDEAAFKLTSD